MDTVVFACVQSAGRSQMAVAFFNQSADPGRARAVSAGTRPAERVHPEVVEAMLQVGVDLREARPTLLTPSLLARADLLITMGCGDACPAAPGVERNDWPLPDPHGQPPDTVARIRDDIRRRVAHLIDARRYGAAPRAARR